MLGARASRLLLNASHELRGAGAPLLLVLAGTPELEDTLRSAEASHWERGHKIPLGRLDAESAPSALLEPLKKHGASMTEDALDIAMRETSGYPFFLQLFGRHLVEAMNEARSGQADKAITERAAKAFHPDQGDFYKGRRSELRIIGGTLPAAAAWGAIRGFGEEASCDLVLAAMEPHCDDVHDIWHRLQRSGMLWEKAEGGRASPACWTARCGRPGHRQTPPTRQDLQSVVNGRSGVPPLLARNNGHWRRCDDLLMTNFAADAIKLPAIRAAASGSVER